MLRRVAFLSLMAGALALLGVSIVFAQQTAPAGDRIGVVVPQATPGTDSPGPQPAVTATPGSETQRPPAPTPRVDAPTAPQTMPVPQPIATPAGPAQQPNLPQTGANILIANIPAHLQPVPELKPLPGPAVTLNAPANLDLRPIPEAKPLPGPMPATMTFDAANPPVPEVKPLLPALPAFAPQVKLNDAPPHLQPVPEPR
jgi:hypothetical protein